jgi:hypothetical protein
MILHRPCGIRGIIQVTKHQPEEKKGRVYSNCVQKEFVYLTRFRTSRIALPQQTKNLGGEGALDI